MEPDGEGGDDQLMGTMLGRGVSLRPQEKRWIKPGRASLDYGWRQMRYQILC